jgi:AbrB family looped-hinge helix DNA binding protein
MQRNAGTFVARVIEGGRVTIPKDVRQKLEIEDGAYVCINLVKLDLLRMSMHKFFTPEREGEPITKQQVSATKFK